MAFFGPNNTLVFDDERGIAIFKHLDSDQRGISLSSTEYTLFPSDSNRAEEYGYSVAVGSGTIAVGDRANLGYQQFNADGRVYAYDLNGTIISAAAVPGNNEDSGGLTLSEAVGNIGSTLAVSGGRIVTGGDAAFLSDDPHSYAWNLNFTALESVNEADDGYKQSNVAAGCGRIIVAKSDNTFTGKVHIFDNYDSGGTSIYRRLFRQNNEVVISYGPNPPTSMDNFARNVAIGDGRIAVSGDPEDSDQSPVVLFDMYGNEVAKIAPPDYDYMILTNRGFAGQNNASDDNPNMIAIGNGRIVVGRPGEDNLSYQIRGAAYVYDLNGEYLFKLEDSGGADRDEYGIAVAVGNNRIVVGAPRKNADAGRIFIYDLDGNHIDNFGASDSSANSLFGFSLDIGCNRLIVGAPGFRSPDTANQTGKAYCYKFGNSIQTYFEDVLDYIKGNDTIDWVV